MDSFREEPACRVGDLVTNTSGEVHQFFLYNAWGENMHEYNPVTPGFDSPYRFNAKEVDNEIEPLARFANTDKIKLVGWQTGLAYYGARYYQNKFSVWLSVDALSNDFPSVSPYNFTMNNPVKLVDPDGNAPTNPLLLFGKALWRAYTGRHPGVTTKFFEGRVSGGVGVYGGHLITQSAVAYDEVGETHFESESEIIFNTLEGDDANFALGGLAAASFGVQQDFNTETYLGQQYESSHVAQGGVAAGVGPSVSYGERGWSIAIAIGFGTEVSMYETTTTMSISLSHKEAEDVYSHYTGPNKYWGLGPITDEADGLVSAFVTIGLPQDKATTDVKVFSRDGGVTWMSISYEIGAKEVEGL